MSAEIDFVLCIGFGGPTDACCHRKCENDSACPFPSRAACFVSGILGDNPARQARVDEVAKHYEHFNGVSPYNALSAQQAQTLEQCLGKRGQQLPVFVAYRHWAPWPQDVLKQIAAQGLKNGLLLILAPHQSSVSWDWYIKTAAEAQEAVAEQMEHAPQISVVAQPWWNAEGYIEALAGRLDECCSGWDDARKQAARFIFTAHAIPKTIEDTSPYRKQFEETAALTAKAFGLQEHVCAFQSQPGDSSIPWSAPDVCDVIKELHQQGVKEIVCQAAGFLVDHMEVLYDLDLEAKELAESLGMTFHRAACVHDHERFIDALADRVEDAIHAAASA